MAKPMCLGEAALWVYHLTMHIVHISINHVHPLQKFPILWEQVAKIAEAVDRVLI